MYRGLAMYIRNEVVYQCQGTFFSFRVYIQNAKRGKRGFKFLEDYPNSKIVASGDFNVHNFSWLHQPHNFRKPICWFIRRAQSPYVISEWSNSHIVCWRPPKQHPRSLPHFKHWKIWCEGVWTSRITAPFLPPFVLQPTWRFTASYKTIGFFYTKKRVGLFSDNGVDFMTKMVERIILIIPTKTISTKLYIID